MSDDKMTIDDLIEHLLPWCSYEKCSTGIYEGQYGVGVVDAYREVVKYIKANRDRLKAGMRGTLRFRIQFTGDAYSAFFIPDDPRAAPYLLFDRWQNETLLRGRCENFADAIKMTAEFIEDE